MLPSRTPANLGFVKRDVLRGNQSRRLVIFFKKCYSGVIHKYNFEVLVLYTVIFQSTELQSELLLIEVLSNLVKDTTM